MTYEHTQPLYIVKDRQTGKTTALVEWVKAGSPIDSMLGWSRIIIVRNQAMKREMLHRYRLQGGQVVARQEIAQVGRGGYIRALDLVTFAIDDAEDLILDSFPDAFWGRIRIVSMSGRNDLMEAEILRWAHDHTGEQIQARLAELDSRLADQPDPTLLNAEGDLEDRYYRFGAPIGAAAGGAINAETAQPRVKTAKKTATKKTGTKRP